MRVNKKVKKRKLRNVGVVDCEKGIGWDWWLHLRYLYRKSFSVVLDKVGET